MGNLNVLPVDCDSGLVDDVVGVEDDDAAAAAEGIPGIEMFVLERDGEDVMVVVCRDRGGRGGGEGGVWMCLLRGV